MKRSLLFVFTALVFASCSQPQQPENIVVDVESAIGTESNKMLTDYIESIEYIPLETTSEIILNRIYNVYVTDDYFVVF